jgi:hypothetical protein
VETPRKFITVKVSPQIVCGVPQTKNIICLILPCNPTKKLYYTAACFLNPYFKVQALLKLKFLYKLFKMVWTKQVRAC